MSPSTPEVAPPPPPPETKPSISEDAAAVSSKLPAVSSAATEEEHEEDAAEAKQGKEEENVLNPTQILNIVGLNPMQQSAAKDAIMSIAELSKHLQLGQVRRACAICSTASVNKAFTRSI